MADPIEALSIEAEPVEVGPVEALSIEAEPVDDQQHIPDETVAAEYIEPGEPTSVDEVEPAEPAEWTEEQTAAELVIVDEHDPTEQPDWPQETAPADDVAEDDGHEATEQIEVVSDEAFGTGDQSEAEIATAGSGEPDPAATVVAADPRRARRRPLVGSLLRLFLVALVAVSAGLLAAAAFTSL